MVGGREREGGRKGWRNVGGREGGKREGGRREGEKGRDGGGTEGERRREEFKGGREMEHHLLLAYAGTSVMVGR